MPEVRRYQFFFLVYSDRNSVFGNYVVFSVAKSVKKQHNCGVCKNN